MLQTLVKRFGGGVGRFAPRDHPMPVYQQLPVHHQRCRLFPKVRSKPRFELLAEVGRALGELPLDHLCKDKLVCMA